MKGTSDFVIMATNGKSLHIKPPFKLRAFDGKRASFSYICLRPISTRVILKRRDFEVVIDIFKFNNTTTQQGGLNGFITHLSLQSLGALPQ
ncbi:hypothetical protein NS2R_22025 [Pseudomonas oryzihabitans]|nr:hypothetical protein NS2R_22025 [Pseudomonas psychrotolerans]